MISVQTDDFDPQAENQQLISPGNTGALVSFVGLVREFSAHRDDRFLLQHYPGMTEAVLEKIEAQAHTRWELHNTRIIHRIGKLQCSDQIVYIGVTSKHRKHAFAACEYMIDMLKTQAPFWKKEGDEWVTAKDDDQLAAQAWLK